MEISNAVALSILLLFAISLGGCSMKQEPLKLAEPIKSELDKAVAEMACMPAEPFPFVSEEHPNLSCNNCAKLAEAGLLTKEGGKDPASGDTPIIGRPEVNVRYDLSDLGQSAYVPSSAGNSAYGASRFCFGKAHVFKITRIFGPVMLGGQKNIGIRYIAQLDEPNPYISDSRAKLLGIPLPIAVMPGKPVLYPELDITAVINPNNPNDVYLDGSLHIGPIGQK